MVITAVNYGCKYGIIHMSLSANINIVIIHLLTNSFMPLRHILDCIVLCRTVLLYLFEVELNPPSGMQYCTVLT